MTGKIWFESKTNELLTPPPESKRIESHENKLSFRRQHPNRFGEELLRCGGKVEAVRQDDQIEGFVGKGERFGMGDNAAPVFAKRFFPFVRCVREKQPVLRHAIRAKRVKDRQSDLQRTVAEDVLDHPVQKPGFPLSDNLSGRREEKGERFFGLHVVRKEEVSGHHKVGALRAPTP